MGEGKRKHNRTLTARAIELRKGMTQQERKLWYEFLREYPVRFLRQKVVDRFIVDFYCAKAKLVVELDGGQHFSAQGMAYDEERGTLLETYGLTTLRFTNAEVDNQFFDVCMEIDQYVKKTMCKGKD